MKSLLAAVTLPAAAAFAPALAPVAAPSSLPSHRLDAAVAAALSTVVAIFATTSSPVDATMAPDLVRYASRPREGGRGGEGTPPWPRTAVSRDGPAVVVIVAMIVVSAMAP